MRPSAATDPQLQEILARIARHESVRASLRGGDVSSIDRGAGALGLLSGYLAMYSIKGQTVHRLAGIVFVCPMLTMTAAGFLLAVMRDAARGVNIPGEHVIDLEIVSCIPGRSDFRGVAIYQVREGRIQNV